MKYLSLPVVMIRNGFSPPGSSEFIAGVWRLLSEVFIQ